VVPDVSQYCDRLNVLVYETSDGDANDLERDTCRANDWASAKERYFGQAHQQRTSKDIKPPSTPPNDVR